MVIRVLTVHNLNLNQNGNIQKNNCTGRLPNIQLFLILLSLIQNSRNYIFSTVLLLLPQYQIKAAPDYTHPPHLEYTPCSPTQHGLL